MSETTNHIAVKQLKQAMESTDTRIQILGEKNHKEKLIFTLLEKASRSIGTKFYEICQISIRCTEVSGLSCAIHPFCCGFKFCFISWTFVHWINFKSVSSLQQKTISLRIFRFYNNSKYCLWEIDNWHWKKLICCWVCIFAIYLVFILLNVLFCFDTWYKHSVFYLLFPPHFL